MRVCFQYADDTYLYVLPVDTVADEPLRVRYNVPQINEEFAETCRILWRHAQVNLLDVTVDEVGILTPSFIILEPDYLIDISSLAECFKDYGHHPANYILARLQSPDNTRPLLLGNIANLFLGRMDSCQGGTRLFGMHEEGLPFLSHRAGSMCRPARPGEGSRILSDCKRHFDNIHRQ